MAVALGWTMNEVRHHSLRDLRAILKVHEDAARARRMAAAHRRA